MDTILNSPMSSKSIIRSARKLLLIISLSLGLITASGGSEDKSVSLEQLKTSANLLEKLSDYKWRIKQAGLGRYNNEDAFTFIADDLNGVTRVAYHEVGKAPVPLDIIKHGGQCCTAYGTMVLVSFDFKDLEAGETHSATFVFDLSVDPILKKPTFVFSIDGDHAHKPKTSGGVPVNIFNAHGKGGGTGN